MSVAWNHQLSDSTPTSAEATSGWMTLRRRGWTWQIADELQDGIWNSDREPPVVWRGESGGEVVKHNRLRTVERWTIHGQEYFAKTYRGSGLAPRLREWLRGPHACWEAGRIALAMSHGIPTTEVVAVGWSDDRRHRPASVLVTRGLRAVSPLNQMRSPYAAPGDAIAVTDREGLIDAVADLLARLHECGLTHGDLHAGNVVVRRDVDGWRAWLIDLCSLRGGLLGGWTADPLDNLVRLNDSMRWTVSDSERRRFWRRYWRSRFPGGGDPKRRLERFVAAARRYRREVIPLVDAKWQRGNRKVHAFAGGLGLACLGEDWLQGFAAQLPIVWSQAAGAPGVSEHRLCSCETPLGPRTLRIIRIPATAETSVRDVWEQTHAALRRGIPTVVPWLIAEAGDASFLVACQPADAVPCSADELSARRWQQPLMQADFQVARCVEGDLLATPDRRWTGLAAIEQLRRGGKRTSWGFRPRAALLAMAVGLSALSGCWGLQRSPATGLPARHTVKAEQLVVQSDVRLPKNHPLIRDLAELRQNIAQTLKLPLQDQPVTVYLFADEVRYAQYLQTAFPSLPPRRAYFVGTPDELAVYTYWGEKIQEDLRHEYTHGVLHASLKDVPLWLDEGLAEYFEVTSQPSGLNGEYATKLAESLSAGWQPDLRRLEQLHTVGDMQKGDYLESWAWVHFLLHDGDASRDVLLGYIAELRDHAKPGPLSDRLTAAIPAAEERFRAYAATIKPEVQSVNHTARSQSPE